MMKFEDFERIASEVCGDRAQVNKLARRSFDMFKKKKPGDCEQALLQFFVRAAFRELFDDPEFNDRIALVEDGHFSLSTRPVWRPARPDNLAEVIERRRRRGRGFWPELPELHAETVSQISKGVWMNDD